MKVKEIMTARVVTVTPDTPVPVIAALLRDNRISGVPVVAADGAVAGLVSEYDLLAREGETAGEVMTTSVITVSGDTDVVALLTTEWVCQVCGEAARGRHPPARCPKCHAGPDRFVLQDACPGD